LSRHNSKRLNAELGAAEFEALMNAAVDAVIVIDGRGIIEQFNKAAEIMFGYDTVEIVGQNISLLMPQHDRAHHDGSIHRYLDTRVAKIIGIGREVEAVRRDGSVFPVDIAVGEVKQENIVRFVGFVRDITEKKHVEEQVLQQRDEMMRVSRLTTMGEMAAALAHELNQPLSAIVNYAAVSSRLLDAGLEQLDEVKSALQNIDTQAHRASKVIRRIRNFVTSEGDIQQSTSLNTLVEEIRPLAELDAKSNSIALVIEVAENLPDIVVDGLQIQQVILNLLRNGVDAMGDVAPEDRQLKLSGYLESPNEIRVDVVDRGHGVPQEVRKELFDAFFTTKPTGMGMGLAISRTIIRTHGGKLFFVNNTDAGATFSFTLPTKAPK